MVLSKKNIHAHIHTPIQVKDKMGIEGIGQTLPPGEVLTADHSKCYKLFQSIARTKNYPTVYDAWYRCQNQTSVL